MQKKISDKVIVRFGSKEVKAHLADSFLKRAIGLSCRKGLPENEGMLFVFPRPRRAAFWNLAMRFPVDVIWISGSRIIGIAKNIPAVSAGIKIFSPPAKIDYVLEIPAGLADKLDISVGNPVEITK